MSKIVGIVVIFLLLNISCQTLFDRGEIEVEYSPLLTSSFSPRSQPARIVDASQKLSTTSYEQIGVVSTCEDVYMPNQLEKEKIIEMVQALRQQASKQGGDIIRSQNEEDLKKDDILKWRYVKLDDTKVVGKSGSVDILSVVYKKGDDLVIVARNPETGKVENPPQMVHQRNASECVKAGVWRKVER